MGYSNPLLLVVMRMYNERTTIDEIIRRVLAVTFRRNVRRPLDVLRSMTLRYRSIE